MKINELYRMLREERGISQRQAAGRSARTTLTSFENEGTHPSYQSVRDYLQALTLGLDFFETLLQEGEVSVKEQVAGALQESLRDKDYHQVMSLIAGCRLQYQETKDPYDRLLADAYELLLAQAGALSLTPQERQALEGHLNDYLEGLSIWGPFDVALFILLLPLLDFDLIDKRLQNFLQYRQAYPETEKKYHFYRQIALQLLEVARQRHDLARYRQLAQELQKELSPEDLYGQMWGDFSLSLLAIQQDQESPAIQLIQADLAFLRRRGQPQLASKMAAAANDYLHQQLF